MPKIDAVYLKQLRHIKIIQTSGLQHKNRIETCLVFNCESNVWGSFHLNLFSDDLLLSDIQWNVSNDDFQTEPEQ